MVPWPQREKKLQARNRGHLPPAPSHSGNLLSPLSVKMSYGGTWRYFLAQPPHMKLPSGSVSYHVARGILVPQPAMEHVPTAVETWSPNHWTAREGSPSSLLILIPVTLYLLLTWKRKVIKGLSCLFSQGPLRMNSGLASSAQVPLGVCPPHQPLSGYTHRTMISG